MKRLLIAVVLVAAACGDTTATTIAPTATAPATTAAPATSPPTTAAPATTVTPTTTAAGIVPGEDSEVDAVVEAFSVAFDSMSTYEEKAAFIDDPTGLEDTVARYLEQGDTFGGIETLLRHGYKELSVEISGDEATVLYDLYFGGNPTYPNLEATAIKSADGWKVPVGVFCGLMASARTPCSTG